MLQESDNGQWYDCCFGKGADRWAAPSYNTKVHNHQFITYKLEKILALIPKAWKQVWPSQLIHKEIKFSIYE